MVDPYQRYSIPPSEIGGSIPRPSLPGYLASEASTLTTYHPWSSSEVRQSSDFPDRDILQPRPGANVIDDTRSFHPEADLGGLTSGTSIRGYPSPLRDPIFQGKRADAGLGFHEINYERRSSLRRVDDLPVAVGDGDSNILFVDGLPTDCSRREVGHLFRPFIGFKDLRVIHKGPRQSGDKAMVFCFVEFADAKCARTALEALQGYKFDYKKPESPVLKIKYGHFPFRPTSDEEEVQQLGGLR